jgi:uncharacterized protein (DUF924 family)
VNAPDDVLDFWFGARDAPDFGIARDWWFGKSDATDRDIRARFEADVEAALRGERDGWAATPRGTLALILLLDQFTRNIHRDTPRAFAGDARALAWAKLLADSGGNLKLAPIERWFAAMPFEHSELLIDQYESLFLFQALVPLGLPEALKWAQLHFDVIRRFGRFPHRNAVLGRDSSPEELEYLKARGGF